MMELASSRISSLSRRCLTQHSSRIVLHRLRLNVFLQSSLRTFTVTSSPLQRYKKIKIERGHEKVPPYPHGPARVYKKSNRGLYGGARIRFGNNVPKGKYAPRTRRKWKPNVRTSSLYSEALKQRIKIKVTARVLRTIDKLGGLDNYLLGNTSARIKELGLKGWQLRWKIMQSKAVGARFRAEKARLGMTPQEIQESSRESAEMARKFRAAVAPPDPEFLEKQKKFRKRSDVWIGQMARYEDMLLEQYENLPAETKKKLRLKKKLRFHGRKKLNEEDEIHLEELANQINARVVELR